ncbi:hypothetical protein FRC12_018270, partial [Ceratobasidium sp. 428]
AGPTGPFLPRPAVLVASPTHPPHAKRPRDDPNRRPGEGSAPLLYFSTKQYPASPTARETPSVAPAILFPSLPPDHAVGSLPNGANASFSYRGPHLPPVPGAAPPVSLPLGGTPLVFDRERPAPRATSSTRGTVAAGGADQHAELARRPVGITLLSARPNPSAALAQAEARVEAGEAQLAAIKGSWREVENCLDTPSRREAEARTAFVRTLGIDEVVFGAGPTSPYLPRPPALPNVLNRVGSTSPVLPPATTRTQRPRRRQTPTQTPTLRPSTGPRPKTRVRGQQGKDPLLELA